MISSINNLSSLESELIKNINDNYDSFVYFEYAEKQDFMDNLKSVIDNRDYKIFYNKNGDMMFNLGKFEDVANVVMFSYNEIEGWKDMTELYMP